MLFLLITAFLVLRWLIIKQSKISFKEAMDLTDLPVITFYNNGKKANFLLDTGSNCSYVTESSLSQYQYTKLNIKQSVFGLEGVDHYGHLCNLDIYYQNIPFNNDFLIADLEATFNRIKSESGVQLNGILGNDFFKKYKYVLDFENLTAYQKKWKM